MSKTESSVKSMVWSVLGRYLPSVLQIISTIVIARLITPEEFGEVAIITVFIQIASLLVASGFSEALIFKVNNSNALYSTVFYVNIVISLTLYIILFFLSDFIAHFYSISRLSVLTKVVSINIIIYSFSYIQRVLFTIAEDFKRPAIIVFISALLGSAFGVFLAFKGFGVWSLVFQTLLINFLQLIMFWKFSKWRPLLVFSKKELVEILPFSTKILFNNAVQIIYDNIYTLVIGKYFTATILGYYNRMQTLVYFTTTNFMYAIESVFYPKLCKRNDDFNFLKNSYEILIRLATFIAFPVLVILLSLGKPIIIVLLSEKWIGSLKVLEFLSVAYFFIPVTYMNNSFLKILNKTEILFYSGLFKKIIGLVILAVTINYGFDFVLYGLIFYTLVDAFISMIFTQALLKINIFRQLRYVKNNILLNTSLFFVLTYVSSLISENFTKTFVSIFIGVLFYVTIPIILNLKEFSIIKSIIKNR